MVRSRYIDRWALRSFEEEWLPFDVWECVHGNVPVPAGEGNRKNWCVHGGAASRAKYGAVGRLRWLTPDMKPIPVISAFNGAAVYNMDYVEGCDYGTGMNAVGHGECEHVALHKCIRDRNKGKIFINPKFIIRKSHCDTPTQCVTWASLAHFQEVVVPLASQVVPAGPISKSTNVVVAIITAQSEKLVALLAAADILDLPNPAQWRGSWQVVYFPPRGEMRLLLRHCANPNGCIQRCTENSYPCYDIVEDCFCGGK